MSRIRGTTPSHIDRLKDSLSARPVRDTEIINVSFTDAEAKEAQLITNTVLEQYMSYISVMTETTQTKIYDELVNQCNTLQGEIQVLETRVADSRRRLNTTSPEELISSKKLRLDETQARFIQVQQNIALLEWEKSRTVSADGNDVPADANDGNQKHAKYYEDEEWQKLDDNVRTIRYRIDTSLLTPNHPDYTQAYYYLGESSGRLGDMFSAHYNLGQFYQRKGDLKNAGFHLNRALKLAADDAQRKMVERSLSDLAPKKPKPSKAG